MRRRLKPDDVIHGVWVKYDKRLTAQDDEILICNSDQDAADTMMILHGVATISEMHVVTGKVSWTPALEE